MSSFQFREALPGDEEAIRTIVFSVLGDYGLKSDPTNTDSDLQDISKNYSKRGGAFRVLISANGKIVGCGGLFPLDEEEAEVRKMYLLPETRGHGYGRKLLQDLIDFARQTGFKRVVLETASVLKEAISLYRNFGFVPVQRGHLASRCDQAFVLDLVQEQRCPDNQALLSPCAEKESNSARD